MSSDGFRQISASVAIGFDVWTSEMSRARSLGASQHPYPAHRQHDRPSSEIRRRQNHAEAAGGEAEQDLPGGREVGNLGG